MRSHGRQLHYASLLKLILNINSILNRRWRVKGMFATTNECWFRQPLWSKSTRVPPTRWWPEQGRFIGEEKKKEKKKKKNRRLDILHRPRREEETLTSRTVSDRSRNAPWWAPSSPLWQAGPPGRGPTPPSRVSRSTALCTFPCTSPRSPPAPPRASPSRTSPTRPASFDAAPVETSSSRMTWSVTDDDDGSSDRSSLPLTPQRINHYDRWWWSPGPGRASNAATFRFVKEKLESPITRPIFLENIYFLIPRFPDMYIYIYIREKFRRIYFLAGEEEGRRNVEQVWNTGISTKTNVHRISSSPIREGPRRGCSHLEVSDRDRRSCERRSRAWRPSAAAETGHELARDHKLRLRFLSCSRAAGPYTLPTAASRSLSLSRTVLLLLLGRSSPAPASPPRLSSAPPPDYMPPLLPPLVDTDRPSLLLALFTPLLSALVFAPRDVGGIQHAIQNAFTGKEKGNPGQLRRKIVTIFRNLFFPRDICENNLFCSSSSTS